MRTPTATATRRTIDLTSDAPRVRFAAQEHSYSATSDRAIRAFAATRRRRRAGAMVEATADATMAVGALTIANVSLGLNLGLPGGIAGAVLGVALLGLGAMIALGRRNRSGGTDPATSMTPARVIVLDDAPNTVIRLDDDAVATARHRAA